MSFPKDPGHGGLNVTCCMLFAMNVYLAYVDESGKPDMRDQSEEFVLSAIVVNETNWRSVDKEVRKLKKRYFPEKNPDEVEIHMKTLAHHGPPFNVLSLKMQKELIYDIAGLISNIDCTIVSVVVLKRKVKPKDQEGIQDRALTLLFEKVHHCLLQSNRSKGHKEMGLIFFDSVNPSFDNKIRSKVHPMILQGTGNVRNRYLIEDPVFVESSYRALGQLADFISYCVRRKYMTVKNEESARIYAEVFSRLRSKFLFNGEEGKGVIIVPHRKSK